MTDCFSVLRFSLLAVALLLLCNGDGLTAEEPLVRTRIEFKSTADDSKQAAYIILPSKQRRPGDPDRSRDPKPLVVSLHTWSGDMEQRNTTLERAVYDEGWIYLFPNFRGANRTPAACGSALAQQDILDAVDWVLANHNVEKRRIYLTGVSGGGHMTMLMAGRYPDRWRAASAIVGISDLAAWHAKHKGTKYGNMMEACCGGAPGDSPEVDAEYRSRSPLTYMANAKDVAIDIGAGVHDGHTGSVPVRHSLDAFNEIAKANGTPLITEGEIAEISKRNGRLSSPKSDDKCADLGFDLAFGKHYLRRMSGDARVTIFEGGHEGKTTATMAWFKRQAIRTAKTDK